MRLGRDGLSFVKHRHFIAEYRLFQRPMPFGKMQPENPVKRYQDTGLLVYDDLTDAPDNYNYEEVLTELFENRICHYKPSIITSNLNRQALQTAVGSRIYDRLQLATNTVLEFGFESKRKALNADYLKRSGF